MEVVLVIQAVGVKLEPAAVDIQKPNRWFRVVLGQRRNFRGVWPVGPDPVFTSTAKTAVAKAVYWRVFALVVIVLTVELLDNNLQLLQPKWWVKILVVVFK